MEWGRGLAWLRAWWMQVFSRSGSSLSAWRTLPHFSLITMCSLWWTTLPFPSVFGEAVLSISCCTLAHKLKPFAALIPPLWISSNLAGTASWSMICWRVLLMCPLGSCRNLMWRSAILPCPEVSTLSCTAESLGLLWCLISCTVHLLIVGKWFPSSCWRSFTTLPQEIGTSRWSLTWNGARLGTDPEWSGNTCRQPLRRWGGWLWWGCCCANVSCSGKRTELVRFFDSANWPQTIANDQ